MVFTDVFVSIYRLSSLFHCLSCLLGQGVSALNYVTEHLMLDCRTLAL